MEAPELIAKENIPMIWPIIGPRLGPAMEKLQSLEYSLPDVHNMLREGYAQLWIAGAGEMIAITRIVNYPNVKRLVVDFIEGSDPEDHFDQLEYIEHWAVSLGATQSEASLRPGLEKLARKQGYGRRRVQVFKMLKAGIH
jgi:hypothetical protein